MPADLLGIRPLGAVGGRHDLSATVDLDGDRFCLAGPAGHHGDATLKRRVAGNFKAAGSRGFSRCRGNFVRCAEKAIESVDEKALLPLLPDQLRRFAGDRKLRDAQITAQVADKGLVLVEADHIEGGEGAKRRSIRVASGCMATRGKQRVVPKKAKASVFLAASREGVLALGSIGGHEDFFIGGAFIDHDLQIVCAAVESGDQADAAIGASIGRVPQHADGRLRPRAGGRAQNQCGQKKADPPGGTRIRLID